MNPVILLGGAIGTVLLAAFIAEWVIEGFVGALKMLAFMVSTLAGAAAIVAFWAWMAGAFA